MINAIKLNLKNNIHQKNILKLFLKYSYYNNRLYEILFLYIVSNLILIIT